MRGLTLPPMTFVTLNGMLRNAALKGQHELQIAYATSIEYATDGNVVVKHHGTPIAHIGRTWFTLSHAGWHTSTTTDRLDKIIVDNSASAMPVEVEGSTRFRVTIKERRAVVKAYRFEGGKIKEEIAQSFDDYDTAHFSRVDTDHHYMLHAHS